MYCVSLFSVSQKFQFKAGRPFALKCAGLGLWWNLPEECFRGPGPRAMTGTCVHVSVAGLQTTCERTEEEEGGGGRRGEKRNDERKDVLTD